MATLLPSHPTPRRDGIGQQTILIYGRPKIGKSTFASQFPHALFLPTEPGLNHLQVFQAPADGSGIQCWEQLRQILAEVATGEHQFETIVVDTVDNAWKLCSDYIVARYNKRRSKGGSEAEHLGDLPKGSGYAYAAGEFERVLRKAIQLPYGLILTSHAKEITPEGGGPARHVLTLQETCRKIVCGLADITLYCDFERGEDGWRRVLRTKPTPQYEAGDRSGRLPSTVPMDFASFLDAFGPKAAK